MASVHRVLTGSDALDNALGGGIPCGATLLVEGPQGVGATEFALTLLKAATAGAPSHKGAFLTALRSSDRVRREAAALFERPEEGATLDVDTIRPPQAQADCLEALATMAKGDVLAIESVSALARCEPAREIVGFVETLANAAERVGCVLVLLHAPGAIPHVEEARVAEAVDGILTFSWREAGPTRRRHLTITKLRGLAPVLDGEEVPVFDAALHAGVGFSISRVRNVV